VSIPNGLQRDFHSLFSPAFAHIRFWDLGTVYRARLRSGHCRATR
jgi:hypothetical protein